MKCTPHVRRWLLGTQDNGFWRTTDSAATRTQVSTTNMAHGGGEIYYAKTGALYVASGDGVRQGERHPLLGQLGKRDPGAESGPVEAAGSARLRSREGAPP